MSSRKRKKKKKISVSISEEVLEALDRRGEKRSSEIEKILRQSLLGEGIVITLSQEVGEKLTETFLEGEVCSPEKIAHSLVEIYLEEEELRKTLLRILLQREKRVK
jgi:metal-responsive CopG/Arc/MetJ family transcriptional regulator